MIRKVHYTDATPAELRLYGEQRLGLDLSKNLSGAMVRAKIEQVETAPAMIEFDDPMAMPQAPGTPPPPRRLTPLQFIGSKEDPIVELTIQQSAEVGGKRAVFINCDGTPILLPRGVKFACAYRFYLVLNDAVTSTYNEDPTTGLLDETRVHTYPFMVHKMPSDEELARFYARDLAA